MNQFETHVYATVRVKVLGTNFADSAQEVAAKVTEAVCARPAAWFQPVYGSVTVDGVGAFDVAEVEFADGVSGVLVDEIDPATSRVVKEHLFDERCAAVVEQPSFEGLNRALDEFSQCLGIPGAEGEARARLTSLFNQKTSWTGVREINLCVTISNALNAREY